MAEGAKPQSRVTTAGELTHADVGRGIWLADQDSFVRMAMITFLAKVVSIRPSKRGRSYGDRQLPPATRVRVTNEEWPR